jgi:hypothetical protein
MTTGFAIRRFSSIYEDFRGCKNGQKSGGDFMGIQRGIRWDSVGNCGIIFANYAG